MDCATNALALGTTWTLATNCVPCLRQITKKPATLGFVNLIKFLIDIIMCIHTRIPIRRVVHHQVVPRRVAPGRVVHLHREVPITVMIAPVMEVAPLTVMIAPVMEMAPTTVMIAPVMEMAPTTVMIAPVLEVAPTTVVIPLAMAVDPTTRTVESLQIVRTPRVESKPEARIPKNFHGGCSPRERRLS
jgi:hypothetical protein